MYHLQGKLCSAGLCDIFSHVTYWVHKIGSTSLSWIRFGWSDPRSQLSPNRFYG